MLDPLMSECLIYRLKEGKTPVGTSLLTLLRSFWLTLSCTQVGRMYGNSNAVIRLSGGNILDEHCFFENTDGHVTLQAMPDSITVMLSWRAPEDDELTFIITASQWEADWRKSCTTIFLILSEPI
jgi:kinesin family protein 1